MTVLSILRVCSVENTFQPLPVLSASCALPEGHFEQTLVLFEETKLGSSRTALGTFRRF
jgi:hypothetical protein